MKGKVFLGLLLLAVLLIQVDTFYLTPAKAVASAHLFSIWRWEATNLHHKWLHLLIEMLPGRKPSREERLHLLQEYLLLARLAQKEKDRLEGLPRGATLAQGGATKARDSASHEYLDELLKSKEKLRARAEEAMEADLSAVFKGEGLGSRLGFLFPPVDLRFGRLPTMLLAARRDRIQLSDAILLRPEIPGVERDRLEKEILKGYNLSALVEDLGGLSTYPSIVPDVYPLRTILRIAAHEWLHQYFFFRPLGRHMRDSEDMFTLNETVADLAGNELGDKAFARMGGDLSVSWSLYLPDEERDPFFTREIRKTRQQVEELLSQGRIEEAEQYMKERWWFFVLRHYPLRKLNTAYFAFHGRYATSAASVSPIDDQLKELRSLLPSVGEFIKTISRVSSYQEFLDLLERLKAQQRGQGH